MALFLFWAGAVFTLLVIIALILFRIFFPPDKIREIANQVVQDNINRQLTIGKVSVNPFTGFEISNIHLYKHPGDSLQINDVFPVESATIEKVVLKYSLRQIFSKKVHINQVIVESPFLEIYVQSAPQDTIPDSKPMGNPLAVLDSLVLPNLPVSFSLKILKITDAKFSLHTADSSLVQSIQLGNIGLYLKDMNIPKGNLVDEKEQISGNMQLVCNKTDFSFTQFTNGTETLSLQNQLDLKVDVDIQGFSIPKLLLDLNVENIVFKSVDLKPMEKIEFPFPINLYVKANASLDEKNIAINPLTLSVDSQQWLELNTRVDSLSTNPKLDLEFSGGRIKIEQLLELATIIVPDSMLPTLYLHNKDSQIEIKKLTAKGPVPIEPEKSYSPITFAANIALNDFGVTVNYGEMEIENLNLGAQTNGSLDINGLKGLTGSISANYDSLYLALNDTFQVYTGAADIQVASNIGADLLPQSVNGTIKIQNALGAVITGDFDLLGSSFAELRGTGDFTVSNFNTTKIPDLPVQTTCGLSAHLQMSSLDSISSSISATTDSLVLIQPNDQLVFPPIDFKANLIASTEPTFQNASVKNMTIQLNDLLFANLNAKVEEVGKKGFWVNLENATVNHNAIFKWIPQQYKAPLEELVFTGQTTLTASGSGKIDGENLLYNAKADANINITQVKYPPVFISLGGLNLDLAATASSKTGLLADLSILIDSTTVATVRPEPFLANKLSLQVKSSDFKTITAKEGKLEIPSLAASAIFDATVDSLPSNPFISANLELTQESMEVIPITRELGLNGKTVAKVAVKMDTSLMDVSAHMVTKNLNIFLPAETTVNDIECDIHAHQQINLVSGELISRADHIFKTPSISTVDYQLFKNYYHNVVPNISTISIKSVNAAGYGVENIFMEAFIGEGLFEVPILSANVYGGNVAGRISLDLAGGDPNKMHYELSTTFSNINSALLLPGKVDKGDEGTINANLNMTGKGVDPNGRINLDGYFYITRIGPKVADNMLRSLDPEGVDFGIKMTRLLINQGFKPKLFTFMIRNNYFYPTVEFNQPIYFPVRISSGKVELNRMPANFFIQNALKNAQLQAQK